MSTRSILTFNLSVSGKKDNIQTINKPFQILPATQHILLDRYIEPYPQMNNPQIILHMNYITRCFNPAAIMNDSPVRMSLRQYVKLANKLGTKNILIHMPATLYEYNNLDMGLNVINDEIVKQGFMIHLEIPSFSNDLMKQFMKPPNPSTHEHPLMEYLSHVIDEAKKLMNDKIKFVPDTAHMFANGCDSIDDFKQIFEKYDDIIEYVHLNGNINYMHKMDKHCPIFSEYNRIKCWEELSKYIALKRKICIAEITKITSDWEHWEQFANEYGFKLNGFNEKYTI